MWIATISPFSSNEIRNCISEYIFVTCRIMVDSNIGKILNTLFFSRRSLITWNVLQFWSKIDAHFTVGMCQNTLICCLYYPNAVGQYIEYVFHSNKASKYIKELSWSNCVSVEAALY